MFRSTSSAADALPFEALDFIYTPSADVAADVRYFTEVLGGRLAFAAEGMGARVAQVELAAGPPHVLLTDHLEGERAILVYRVASLRETMRELESRGWTPEGTFEIPHGPICSFTTPSGHRVAVYEAARPRAADHLQGRRDF